MPRFSGIIRLIEQDPYRQCYATEYCVSIGEKNYSLFGRTRKEVELLNQV